jgi:hypothetical protein
MGMVCAKCLADNRERAMYCKGCGSSLQAAAAPTASAPLAGEEQATDPPAAPFGPGALGVSRNNRWVVGFLLAAVALVAWLYLQQITPSSRSVSSPSESQPGTSVAPVVELREPSEQDPPNTGQTNESALSTVSPSAPPDASTSESDRANALIARNAELNRERIDRQRPERRLAPREQAPAAQAPERQRADQPRSVEQSPPEQPAVIAPTQQEPVTPALTVARICDSAGNFLTREVCRFRECLKVAQANDPICVRNREMEEAQRSREQNL